MPSYATNGQDLSGDGVILAFDTEGAGTNAYLETDTGEVVGQETGGPDAGAYALLTPAGTNTDWAVRVRCKSPDRAYTPSTADDARVFKVGLSFQATALPQTEGWQFIALGSPDPSAQPFIRIAHTDAFVQFGEVGPTHDFALPWTLYLWHVGGENDGSGNEYIRVRVEAANGINEYSLRQTASDFARYIYLTVGSVGHAGEGYIRDLFVWREGDSLPSSWAPANFTREKPAVCTSAPSGSFGLLDWRGSRPRVKVLDLAAGSGNVAVPVGAAFNGNVFRRSGTDYTVGAGAFSFDKGAYGSDGYKEFVFLDKTAAAASQSAPVGVPDWDTLMAHGSAGIQGGLNSELESREAWFFNERSAVLFVGASYSSCRYVDRNGLQAVASVGEALDWPDASSESPESELCSVLLYGGSIPSSPQDPDAGDQPRIVQFSGRPQYIELQSAGLYILMPPGEIVGAVHSVAPFGHRRCPKHSLNVNRLNERDIPDYLYTADWDAALPSEVQTAWDWHHERLPYVVAHFERHVRVDEGKEFADFPTVTGWEETQLRVWWTSLRDPHAAPVAGYEDRPHGAPLTLWDGTVAKKSCPLPGLVSMCLSAQTHQNEQELAPVVLRAQDNYNAAPIKSELCTLAGGYAHFVDIPFGEDDPDDFVTYWTPGVDWVRRPEDHATRAEVEAALPGLAALLGGGPELSGYDESRLPVPYASSVANLRWASSAADARTHLTTLAEWIRDEMLLLPAPSDIVGYAPHKYGVLSDHSGGGFGDNRKFGLIPFRLFMEGLLVAFLTAPSAGSGNFAEEYLARCLDAWSGTEIELPLSGDALLKFHHLIRYVGDSTEKVSTLYAAWATAEFAEVFGFGAGMARLIKVIDTGGTIERDAYAQACALAGMEILHAYASQTTPDTLRRAGCYYRSQAGSNVSERQDGGIPQQPGEALYSDVGDGSDSCQTGWDPDAGVLRWPEDSSNQGTWDSAASVTDNDAGWGTPGGLYNDGRYPANNTGVIGLQDNGGTKDGSGNYLQARYSFFFAEPEVDNSKLRPVVRIGLGRNNVGPANSAFSGAEGTWKEWKTRLEPYDNGLTGPFAYGGGHGDPSTEIDFSLIEADGTFGPLLDADWGRSVFQFAAWDGDSTGQTHTITVPMPRAAVGDTFRVRICFSQNSVGTVHNPTFAINGVSKTVGYVAAGGAYRKPFVFDFTGITVNGDGNIVFTFSNPSVGPYPKPIWVEIADTSSDALSASTGGTGGCRVDILAAPLGTQTLPLDSAGAVGAGWTRLTAAAGSVITGTGGSLKAYRVQVDHTPTSRTTLLAVCTHRSSDMAECSERPVSLCGWSRVNVSGANTRQSDDATVPSMAGASQTSDINSCTGAGITSPGVADPAQVCQADNQLNAAHTRAASCSDLRFAFSHYLPLHMAAARVWTAALGAAKLPGAYASTDGTLYPHVYNCAQLNPAHWGYWSSQGTGVTGRMETAGFFLSGEPHTVLTGAGAAVGAGGYASLETNEKFALAFSVRPAAGRGRADLWDARAAQELFTRLEGDGRSAWWEWQTGGAPPEDDNGDPFATFLPTNIQFVACSTANVWDRATRRMRVGAAGQGCFRHETPTIPTYVKPDGDDAADARNRHQKAGMWSFWDAGSTQLHITGTGGLSDAYRNALVTADGVRAAYLLDSAGEAVEVFGLPSGINLLVSVGGGADTPIDPTPGGEDSESDSDPETPPDASDIAGYIIKALKVSDATYTIHHAGLPALVGGYHSFTVRGLTPGTEYQLYVAAYDLIGQVGDFNAVGTPFTTCPADSPDPDGPDQPDAPTPYGFCLSTEEDGGVLRWTWTAVAE